MEPKSNNTAIVGIIAVVLIAAAIVGTIVLKPSETNSSNIPAAESTTTSTIDANANYKDGTYSSTGAYRTPESNEAIDVTITVAGGKVTSANVSQDPQARESREYQADFAQNYKSQVIGKALGTLQLDRVSGSSLTSRGFNDALNKIRSQAQI